MRQSLPSPPLLRLLRQAAALRLLLAAGAAALYIVYGPGGVLTPLAALGLERLLFLLLVVSPPVLRRLGRAFLPLALGWLLFFPVAEAGYTTNRPVAALAGYLTAGPTDVANPPIWLVVPVVLAAWHYGRMGLRLSIAVLGAEQALLAALLPADAAFLIAYTIDAVGRLAMLTILGYVVTHLVEAQCAEHQALAEANRQLARRAATVEQLAESRERNRLARELHDTLAHSLTGLCLQLQALGTLLERDPTAVREQLEGAQETVRAGIGESRRAIQALRATPLEDLGLAEALRQFCRRQAERTGVAHVCEVSELDALDPLLEQALYRVAEAALANVERHASARHVALSLRPEEEGGLRLEVTDDGAGFDPASVSEDRFGLAGMAERATLVGAHLTVESAPGGGTRVVMAVQ